MAIRDIILAPDPRLSVVCAPVEKVDASVRQLMEDMMETMYHHTGAGLAAPQIGVLKRVVVMDVSADEDNMDLANPIMMANPEIFFHSEETDTYDEGCLSILEIRPSVCRPKRVKVRYLDQHNTLQELEADNYLAKCIQHEVDHLNGILAYDYQSELKRSMTIKKLIKWQRLEE
jgi:peptide deformylase